MLRIDDLQVHGLAPVSFTLPAGDCVALMGASGTGKSLLLRAIADLDAADGQVFLEGAGRSEMSGPDWRRAVRYVAAEPGWWAPTVAEHFSPSPRLDRLLDSLGLSPRILEAPVARTSTGERQRLGLARALIDEPKVLLLDEPTSALDAMATALVEEVVRFQLLQSRIVVLVTHDLAQAQRLARKVIRLENGAAHFYEITAAAWTAPQHLPGAAA